MLGEAGVYMCLVLIRENFDYKRIDLRVVPWSPIQEGVELIPKIALMDMWDGPPLRINCAFTSQRECEALVQVKGWKMGPQGLWDRIEEGISWWNVGNRGIGWLNYTQPLLGKMDGQYLCVVVCGPYSNYGKRNVQGRPHLNQGIRATQGVYQANEGKIVILTCKVNPRMSFSDFGWWFGDSSIQPGRKYRIEKRLGGTIVLIINDVQSDDEGMYWCWIAKDAWWAHSRMLVSLIRGKYSRRRIRDLGNGTINFHRDEGRENLVVGLIRDFGMIQNVSKITACLPLPQAAGEPIPWGIIPITTMPETSVNFTWNCRQVSIKYEEWINGCLIKGDLTEKECRSLPEYYRWVRTGPYGRGGNIKGRCTVDSTLPIIGYWCSSTKIKVEKIRNEEIFQNVTQQQTLEDEWDTVWGPGLLESYSYLDPVQWCIQWTGEKDQTHDSVMATYTSVRPSRDQKEIWNCTKVFTCDSPESQIGLVPVRVLLKWGCECRGYNHTIKD
ncbi:uncharacterized protein LOC133625630 [Colius striatus]|uniref:uncharacterized protein LOC133625630 n=1 Tax=Colius striatus TaxID=57412 RepID=UPI002B1DBD48|nr:uncharacterized protein LOC133625630 [Colius striatus]